MTLGRPIPPLQLSREERETLERWVRRPTSAQAWSLRARIILICAQGKTNTEVAQQMRLAKPTVGKWRSRFVARRLDEPNGFALTFRVFHTCLLSLLLRIKWLRQWRELKPDVL